MPLDKLKKVWKYCSYNKPFFAFIVVLMFAIGFITAFADIYVRLYFAVAINVILSMLLTGYGLTITRDRIDHGYKLPKIMLKDVVIFGIKGTIVYSVYIAVQAFVLNVISSLLGFPLFNFEEMLLRFDETLNLLFVHNPIHTVIFFILSLFVFYVTSFFGEIGLARLADTKSLFGAFDFKSIFKLIDSFGWRHYARDLTSILVAIVILTFIQSNLPEFFGIEFILWAILGVLIFAAQYLGIGSVYCNIKDNELKQTIEIN